MSAFVGIVLPGADNSGSGALDQMLNVAAMHHGEKLTIRFADHGVRMGQTYGTDSSEAGQDRKQQNLDGTLWIVGDVRVDAQESLLAELKCGNRPVEEDTSDIGLALQAYLMWGDRCVDHILGDFSFAIWDRVRKRLFCARDSFGVRPFYYACDSGRLVFSNNLNAVRAFPTVSKDLHRPALGDFLCFGYNLDEHATCFRQIRRIPPAHTLTIENGGEPALRSYDRIDYRGCTRYVREEEYAEHYHSVLVAAVRDRLRTNRPVFEMSGGLDSTSVAALCAELSADSSDFSGKAITTDATGLTDDDEEPAYAKLAADFCNLEHETVDTGNTEDFFLHCDTAQPYLAPFTGSTRRFAERARGHGCEMFTGQGGDPIHVDSGAPLLDSFRESGIGTIRALGRHILAGRGIRGIGIRPILNSDVPRVIMPPIPDWLDAGFVRQSGSVERWRALFYRKGRYPPGCRSELAFDGLRMPLWTHLFEEYYYGQFPGIECKHPFFDIRVINFLLSIPPSLKLEKKILRKAMASRLPEPILERRKSMPARHLLASYLSDKNRFAETDIKLSRPVEGVDERRYVGSLKEYVRRGSAPGLIVVAPLSLDKWMTATNVV